MYIVTSTYARRRRPTGKQDAGLAQKSKPNPHQLGQKDHPDPHQRRGGTVTGSVTGVPEQEASPEVTVGGRTSASRAGCRPGRRLVSHTATALNDKVSAIITSSGWSIW